MGIIDEKAKFRGYLKPRLWWRYRDDVFDICTQGLPKLLQFTCNALCPTIKFELVYSDGHEHVLGLTLHFGSLLALMFMLNPPIGTFIYLFQVHTPHTAKEQSPLRLL